MNRTLILLVLASLATIVCCNDDEEMPFIRFDFRPKHAYYVWEQFERTVQFNYTSNFNGTIYLMVRSNNSKIAIISNYSNVLTMDDFSDTLNEGKQGQDIEVTLGDEQDDAEDYVTISVPTKMTGKITQTKSIPTTTQGVVVNVSQTQDRQQNSTPQLVFADNLVASNESGITYNVLEEDGKQQTFFTVKGVFLGRTYLNFYLFSNHSAFPKFIYSATNENYTIKRERMENGQLWYKLPYKFPVSVIRKRRAIDQIFTYCIMVIVFLANIGLGCKIDLKLVKETLKKPLAPAIGFFCQFLIMPLLAYFLATSLGFDKKIGLGFFAMGCSPGGGSSNFYTLLLDGDVSLSCTMTILSTIVSMGMIPMWIFTLGQHFIEEGSDARIPFSNIAISLSTMLVAFAIGVLIEHKKKNWSRILMKIIAPLIIIAILIMFVVGTWANLYIFKLYTPKMVLAGCALPYGGFILGGFIAFGCRLPWKSVKTIAIETGIQNTGVPIVLMLFSLPMPEADLAIVAPAAASLFMPIPLWFAIAGRKIWIRCKGYRKLPSNDKEAEANEDCNQNDTDKEIEYDQDGHEVRMSSL